MATHISNIQNGPDDGWWNTDDSDFFNDSTNLIFGDAENSVTSTFLRFVNITIPQQATIEAATLTVESISNSTGGSGTVTIRGSNEDDAVAPSSFTDADDKPKTSASVSWTPPSFDGDTSYTTPDFASVIQEIVDRSGWASGNALSIYLVDWTGTNGSGRQFKSFESGGTVASLSVTYESLTVTGGFSDFPSIFLKNIARSHIVVQDYRQHTNPLTYVV